MKKLILFFFIFIALTCKQQQIPEDYIARVGNSYLTESDIKENLKHSADTSNLQYKLFLKRWLENEVLFLEAEAKKYDRTEKITKQLEDVKKQLAVNEYLEAEIYSKNINITDLEVENYYNEHRDEFVLNEDILKVNVVRFNERKVANDFRNEIIKTENWNATIDKFLKDDLYSNTISSIMNEQYFTQLTLYPNELWKLAKNLQISEVGFPVKIDQYFYVVQLIERYIKDSIAPLNLVKDEIKHRLLVEKRKKMYNELVSSLMQKYKTEIKLNE